MTVKGVLAGPSLQRPMQVALHLQTGLVVGCQAQKEELFAEAVGRKFNVPMVVPRPSVIVHLRPHERLALRGF